MKQNTLPLDPLDIRVQRDQNPHSLVRVHVIDGDGDDGGVHVAVDLDLVGVLRRASDGDLHAAEVAVRHVPEDELVLVADDLGQVALEASVWSAGEELPRVFGRVLDEVELLARDL